jgi:hypothetical protein
MHLDVEFVDRIVRRQSRSQESIVRREPPLCIRRTSRRRWTSIGRTLVADHGSLPPTTSLFDDTKSPINATCPALFKEYPPVTRLIAPYVVDANPGTG